jgi:hypothetical protein
VVFLTSRFEKISEKKRSVLGLENAAKRGDAEQFVAQNKAKKQRSTIQSTFAHACGR